METDSYPEVWSAMILGWRSCMVTFGAAYLTMAALLILWECRSPTSMTTSIAASNFTASGDEKMALATERDRETESLLRGDRESDDNGDDDLE